MKIEYISPRLDEFGTVQAVSKIIGESTRVDENEMAGILDPTSGSFDLCFRGECTPELGDSRP